MRLLQWIFPKTSPTSASPAVPDPKLVQQIEKSRRLNALVAHSDQIRELYLAPLQRHSGWVRHSLYAGLLVVGTFFAWAAWAQLDEVTTGMGKVIPSSREQVIQSLEAGLLAELLVQEGDVVEAGQVLLRIDDVKLGANVQESQSKLDALQAAATRLRAEASGGEPAFSAALAKSNPELIRSETATLRARRNALQAALDSQQQALKLAQDELRITEPLAAKGLVSDIDVLRIQRMQSEARGRMAELQSKFRSEAASELSRIEAELASQSATLVGRADSFKRTLMRAPKRGIVKNIRVTTLGAVVQSGQDILEIVPMDDRLLIETRIRPSDIAFLRPGLPAIVKITAYDSGVYGWLDAQLVQISPDTLRDEVKRDETYYRALVRTNASALRTPTGQSLPIIAGMQAQVDIKTGRKSVLSYLFKPVLRAQEALRER